MDILFKNITAITMDGGNSVLQNACVGVKGAKIAYVGAYHTDLQAKRVIDGADKVLIPGLYNCHTHVPMSLLRGYADDTVLQDWLYNHIFPAEAKFTKGMVYDGTMLSIAEMIASGTIAFTDMYSDLDEIAEAVAETGVKASLSNTILVLDSSNGYDFTKSDAYMETERIIQNYHNTYSGRIKADTGIHAEYTSFPTAWAQVVDYAKAKGLRMQVHVSETKTEHDACKARYGKTPTQVLAEAFVFDMPTTAAHCVWVEEDDMDILAEKGVTVAHNPISNLKLACGVAPVRRMLEKGINVTLGTDGMASNNSGDLFEEMKLAAILQKGISGNPTAVSALQALKMATVNGALAQGRQDESGKIIEGFDADLVLLDFNTPRQTTCYDPVSTTVYATSGRDVAMTMCQGKVLYENGDYMTLDIEKTLFQARQAMAVLR